LESTQQTIVSQTPPPTLLTTYQSQNANQPFMFAIDFVSGHPQYNLTHYPFDIKAFTNTLSGGLVRQRTGLNTTINLTPCTP
jgi:hypothetical protein